MRVDALTTSRLQPWLPSVSIGEVHIVSSGPVCWFVRHVLKQGAMTIAPYIFYGRAHFDPTSISSLALLAHELKHVEQYRAMGHVRFLARYFRDLAGNRMRYSKELPLEAEAYALQARVLVALGPLTS
jgi:hypothetical protein